jgi:hypothetical protein
LLLTADDIAAQIQKEKDATYANDVNVSNIEQERHNIELGDYVNQINAADAAANTTAAADADAQNVYNIQSANVAAQNAENAANYQNQLNDYYAANPNVPRYTDDYGQGITSVLPTTPPNVSPVTGGGTDYTSGGNYDYGDAYIPSVTSNVTSDVPPVTDYTGDYGQGITSVIPDVAPNVSPVTGGGTDYTSGGNYDYGDVYGGDGGCPAPWIPILLADQTTREAGSLEPGMQVWTQHEKTGEWGAFPITAVSLDYANRWKIELTNGNDFVGTSNHRVLTDKGWVEIQKLKSGARLVQPEGFGIVTSAEETTPGAVVKITVHDAHTYVSSGFVSHNIKYSGGVDYGGGGFDDYYEFARGGIASLPKSPGQKLLAAHRAGDMATVHRMLKKVRR